MTWRFTLYDRNNIGTVITEPVNWDKNVAEITRDNNWHGVFFTSQGENFLFYGQAERLLKAEFDQYGLEGNMTMKFEQECSGDFVEFARGKFMFKNYEHYCGDECYVKIPLETTTEIKTIRARLSQKVNLEALKAFDTTTDLVPYTNLGINIELPSKGVSIQDYAINEGPSIERFAGIAAVPTGYSNGVSEYGMISLGFNKEKAAEIGGYFVSPTPTYDRASGGSGDLWGTFKPAINYTANGETSFIWPLFISPIVNLFEGTKNYNEVANPCKVDFVIKGSVTTIASSSGRIRVFLLKRYAGTTGEALSDYQIVNVQDTIMTTVGPGTTITFYTAFTGDVTLNKKESLYLFIGNFNFRTNAQINSGQNAFSVTIDTDSYFKLSNLSKTTPTQASVFLVNEALSRVVEGITNDKVRAYSDYFGRTDSQPYPTAENGCGALECITDGLRIRRQENKIPGKRTPFALSLQDMFDGLAPIHNIGMGLEKDPERAGYNRMRVEPWHYFYQDARVLNCIGVKNITRRFNEASAHSSFQFGYEKFEAEEYTGLDEFLTKRTYRLTFAELKNELVKLSKFIGSGYALEVTRRKGDIDSRDWRYDKDTFIICLTKTPRFHVVFYNTGDKMVISYSGDPAAFSNIGTTVIINGSASNDGARNVDHLSFTPTEVTFHFTSNPNSTVNETADGVGLLNITFTSFFVEQGNVTNPENIIDPKTIYNFRISPVRNAMRWMNKVFSSYKKFNDENKIIFTDGPGNVFAKGIMTSVDCRQELGAIAENQTIDRNIYATPDAAKPFLSTERILFDFPLSVADYKKIEKNPYAAIYFQNDCEEGEGWIDTIRYTPDDGIASFVLIPKLTPASALIDRPSGIITEGGIQIITEDGQDLTIE